MPSSPSDAYPRPDFYREDQSWTSLNGPWDFAFDDADEGLNEQWHIKGVRQDIKRAIEVPYVFQSPASGINEQEIHEVIWYQRTIQDPRTSDQKAKQDRVLARFGAAIAAATYLSTLTSHMSCLDPRSPAAHITSHFVYSTPQKT
jgi:beta-galactosidase/beta-glucuronidase